MPHFHHFSICNQNQSISNLVIFGSFLGHFWVIFEQNTKAIALLFGQKCLIFITFQSAIKINQFQIWSFLGHFWVIFEQNTKAIALLFGQNASFSSLFNLQSKSLNFKFGHFWVIFGSFLSKIPRL